MNFATTYPRRDAGLGARTQLAGRLLLWATALIVLLATPAAVAQKTTVLGRLSANRYGHDSTSNPYSSAGSSYSPTSVNNPYGTYGSPYSPYSATNPYAIQAPRIYAADGTYLGKLSSNRLDPESVSNPYGRYGSPYSPTSITNRTGVYGSPYSPLSPNNPYTVRAPIIVSGR